MTVLDIEALEREAVAFHESLVADAVDIWRDGLNFVFDGLASVDGYAPGRRRELGVMLAVLANAARTMQASYRIATFGYYPQALNIMRTAIECWLAYWYLCAFPGRYRRFLDTRQVTPEFRGMLEAIGRRGSGPDIVVQGWINRLHPYSHVDALGFMMNVRGDGRITSYPVGPERDVASFRHCAREGALTLCAVLEAVENFHLRIGLIPTSAYRNYNARFVGWVGLPA
jgi:hypothetical protein